MGGEGHAFFDYMRNNIPVIRKGGWHLPQLPTDAQVINASDPRVALPIPQSEIDANPNIVQNKRNQQEKGEWHQNHSPFSCFAYFFFKIRCAESDSTTIAPASIAVSFITNRPAPDNNGKPNSPLPRLGTQTSGVVTKKDNVPNVMIIAHPAPTKPIFG